MKSCSIPYIAITDPEYAAKNSIQVNAERTNTKSITLEKSCGPSFSNVQEQEGDVKTYICYVSVGLYAKGESVKKSQYEVSYIDSEEFQLLHTNHPQKFDVFEGEETMLRYNFLGRE